MADTLRIKRRTIGAPGAPSSLANGELAYNEVDHTLYYGEGTGGAGGTASTIVPIGGSGNASNANPTMNSSASPGSSALWSRGDHIHPSDTSRAPINSPTFTGIPAAPTAAANTNTTQIATTAYVFTNFAPLASPVFTGTPTAPLATPGTNTTQIATTSFVAAAVSASAITPSSTAPNMDGVANAGALTTYSRGDHTHPSDTTKANLASPTFTGVPVGPTPAVNTNTTQLATTAFVMGQGYAPLASPTFTGVPAAPTPANGTNTTQLATTAYVLATRLDQLAQPTGSMSLNNQKIINVLDPTNPQDAATKNYVDNVIQGLAVTYPCKAGTTANITLSGTQTVDGIALVAGDRCLVMNQTTAAQNGIYVVNAGAWTRSTDADTWNELVSAFTFVEMGTANADNGYVCTVDPGGTLGTTPITWIQFSGAGQVIAGAGLTKTGNSIDVVGTANRITANADSIDIASTYVGQSSITTLGFITNGAWQASIIGVQYGGTGTVSLTGYVKGSGTGPLTGQATIPYTDITGLGTMAQQNATAVAITGGTIDGITFDMGTF